MADHPCKTLLYWDKIIATDILSQFLISRSCYDTCLPPPLQCLKMGIFSSGWSFAYRVGFLGHQGILRVEEWSRCLRALPDCPHGTEALIPLLLGDVTAGSSQLRPCPRIALTEENTLPYCLGAGLCQMLLYQGKMSCSSVQSSLR